MKISQTCADYLVISLRKHLRKTGSQARLHIKVLSEDIYLTHYARVTAHILNNIKLAHNTSNEGYKQHDAEVTEIITKLDTYLLARFL